MPEGDTLHRLAAAVGPRLRGQPIERLHLREHGEVPVVRGHRIERVEAVGKNLLIVIDRHWTLHVHLGMKGRSRIYDPPRPTPAAVKASTMTLVVPTVALATFRSARHALRPYRDMRLELELRRLGPDLLGPELDLAAVLARARGPGHRDAAICDLLLDQRVAAGIGNVYKSEVLFLAGIFPWRPVASLPDAAIGELYRHARALMSTNLGPGRRATVGSLRGVRRQPGTPRLWVYCRAGRPCLRCRTGLRRSIEGRHARSTYWCPGCQAPSPKDRLAGA